MFAFLTEFWLLVCKMLINHVKLTYLEGHPHTHSTLHCYLQVQVFILIIPIKINKEIQIVGKML